MATTKDKAPTVTPVAALEAELAAAQDDLRAAEVETARQEVAERRILADHPTWAYAPSQHPELVAVRNAYNTAFKTADAARERIGATSQALRAARSAAARLPLPAARAALEQAEAALADLLAEQGGLARAQRVAAQHGDPREVGGVLARRDQLPHKLTAAQMTVLSAKEQVALGEADELESSLPALRQAAKDTLPALQAAKAAHVSAQSKVLSNEDEVADARRRARDASVARRQLIDDMSKDRGPVVRSMPHAGQQVTWG